VLLDELNAFATSHLAVGLLVSRAPSRQLKKVGGLVGLKKINSRTFVGLPNVILVA